jgi:hypothetical protein
LQRFVALKIQKSTRDYAHAALHEIELLSAVAKGDPANSKCVVQLLNHVKHAGPNRHHVCLVTEFLGGGQLAPVDMVQQEQGHWLVQGEGNLLISLGRP